MLLFQENLVPTMKNNPYAMKFGAQSRSSLLILNMIFENCGSSHEFKILGRLGLKIGMCSNFYEIWHLLQTKHGNCEYCTWYWWSWPKTINSDILGPNTEICSDFYEIWHLQQIENANYEYKTRQCLELLRDYWHKMIIGLGWL